MVKKLVDLSTQFDEILQLIQWEEEPFLNENTKKKLLDCFSSPPNRNSAEMDFLEFFMIVEKEVAHSYFYYFNKNKKELVKKTREIIRFIEENYNQVVNINELFAVPDQKKRQYIMLSKCFESGLKCKAPSKFKIFFKKLLKFFSPFSQEALEASDEFDVKIKWRDKCFQQIKKLCDPNKTEDAALLSSIYYKLGDVNALKCAVILVKKEKLAVKIETTGQSYDPLSFINLILSKYQKILQTSGDSKTKIRIEGYIKEFLEDNELRKIIENYNADLDNTSGEVNTFLRKTTSDFNSVIAVRNLKQAFDEHDKTKANMANKPIIITPNVKVTTLFEFEKESPNNNLSAIPFQDKDMNTIQNGLII